MILQALVTRHFRNLTEQHYQFHPRVNLFVGDNGEGKTNLLEAIYFLATTRSFRTAHLQSLLQFEQNDLFVQGICSDGTLERTLSVGLEYSAGRRRELLVNGQKTALHPYVRQLPLVAYSASRLEILRGGPDERRRFLDRGIAMLHPGYLEDLSRYQRVLKQRNSLVQKIGAGEASQRALDAWDREWLESAVPVVRARSHYTAALEQRFREIVHRHSYSLEGLTILYRPSGLTPEGGGGEEALHRIRRRELAAGFTLIGPQRDDLEITIDGHPATEVLSGGEVKMVVLFLKFAKMELQVERFDLPPVFLLDDIDAELDLKIIEKLLACLPERLQLFTTSAKGTILEALKLPSYRRFYIDHGTCRRFENEGS